MPPCSPPLKSAWKPIGTCTCRGKGTCCKKWRPSSQQGPLQGSQGMGTSPAPLRFPHVLVDKHVMYELLRAADYTLPASGPGSVDHVAQGWWLRSFHIERGQTLGRV